MNTSAKFARVAILSSLVAVWVLACDFQKIGNQAQATNVVVATLLTTPPVEIKADAVALQGFDASIPTLPDGGTLDAGALFADAGFTIPPQTLVAVFFGERQGASLDVAPTGIPGAQVSVTAGGRRDLAADGGRAAAATSSSATTRASPTRRARPTTST